MRSFVTYHFTGLICVLINPATTTRGPAVLPCIPGEPECCDPGNPNSNCLIVPTIPPEVFAVDRAKYLGLRITDEMRRAYEKFFMDVLNTKTSSNGNINSQPQENFSGAVISSTSQPQAPGVIPPSPLAVPCGSDNCDSQMPFGPEEPKPPELPSPPSSILIRQKPTLEPYIELNL